MEHCLPQKVAHSLDVVDQVIQILLAAVASLVDIAIQRLFVERISHPHGQSIGDIQEFVSTLIGENSSSSKQCRPLPKGKTVDVDNLLGGVDSLFEVHEHIDVPVDVGQIHEDGGVCQGECYILQILVAFR